MSNQEVITESDYKFIEADDSDWYAIELLVGKWKGVKYMYGQVKVNESPELGTATLSFLGIQLILENLKKMIY